MTGTVRVVLSPGRQSPDLSGAVELESLAGSQLKNVRKAATNWRNGLAALLTLVGTITVVKGRDTIVGLPLSTQIIVGLTLLTALTAATVGSFLSMLAAYGFPQVVGLPAGSNSLRDWKRDEARRALSSLAWAVRLIVVTLILLALAVGLTWYIPREPPAYVTVAYDTTEVCGELARGDANSLVVVLGPNNVEIIPWSDVKALALVRSCED